jgi:hypothetical protein
MVVTPDHKEKWRTGERFQVNSILLPQASPGAPKILAKE